MFVLGKNSFGTGSHMDPRLASACSHPASALHMLGLQACATTTGDCRLTLSKLIFPEQEHLVCDLLHA